MSNDVEDFLNETDFEKHEPIEFGGTDNVGKTVQGTILTKPRLVTLPNKMAKKGEPDEITKLVIDLSMSDGETGSLWVPPRKGMASAIQKAVKEAGATELVVGARLALKRIEDAEPTQPGFSGMHQFVAKYEPPAAGTSVDFDA